MNFQQAVLRGRGMLMIFASCSSQCDDLSLQPGELSDGPIGGSGLWTSLHLPRPEDFLQSGKEMSAQLVPQFEKDHIREELIRIYHSLGVS